MRLLLRISLLTLFLLILIIGLFSIPRDSNLIGTIGIMVPAAYLAGMFTVPNVFFDE